METICLTDITGTLGEWFDRWFDDEVPQDVIRLLEEAYRIAVRELEVRL